MTPHVIHLSDLHLGGGSDPGWQNFSLVERAIESLRDSVAAVIVSGDLGNHPDEVALREVKARLEKLCQSFKIDTQRLIVVPGNHDYRNYGFLGGFDTAPFNAVFPRWMEPRLISLPNGDNVAIFCFDSNTSITVGDGKLAGTQAVESRRM